jgi:hypothetical protein
MHSRLCGTMDVTHWVTSTRKPASMLDLRLGAGWDTLMLILRPTKILAKRLRLELSQPEPPPPNPYADWCVHVFFAARLKYLLFTHTTTLVSAVAPARGVRSLAALSHCFAQAIQLQLARHGFADVWTRQLAPELDQVQIASIPNRSVMGSMNEFIFLGRHHIEEGSVEDANLRLPETPMFGIKAVWPLKAFAGLSGGTSASESARPPPGAREVKGKA